MTLSKTERADLHVLVVDDQVEVRQYVRGVLRTIGISQVSEAGSGREALVAVTEPGAWFDLILCDLRMPDRDGIETIRAFAALGLESAVAIMSIEHERIIETAGMLASAQGLTMVGTISKPVTAAKLEPLFLGMKRSADTTVGASVSAPVADLHGAFARRELRLVYQPKVSMRTRAFAGVEALVRWNHPVLGSIPPGSFVPMMELSEDYSARLADFTLREAIALASIWKENGRDLPVAVNLTPRALEQLDLPDRIETLARDMRVPPALITLEVTETQLPRDSTRMIDVATRLRLKGFSLSIDDFGTGQSGLAQLERFPFSELKIDRQFVHGSSGSSTKRSMVEASIALARNLKMTAVAEGVQERADWDLLAELGCDVAQGYFIAHPMSEEGLDAWSEVRTRRTEA